MRIPRPILFAFALVLAATTAVVAQDHDHDHDHGGGGEASPAADARIGPYPAWLVERPPPLRPGIGRVRYPATTSSPIARTYYEHGLAYIYLYHEVEAARAFRHALRLDPDMAMAHLGLHRAYRRMRAAEHADAALGRAAELAPLVTDRERTRIELAQAAAEARRDADLRDAYLERMDAALERFPDDVELHMLRALNASGEERIRRLRAVVDLDPEHPGAHHELIHAHEGRREYADAVAHGEILSRLAPGIAHARHMFGHNLMRVQRVPDAMRQFAAADSIERAYYGAEGIAREYDWHHPHNLHLLALTYWHRGRWAEAESVLRDRAGVVQANGRPAPWNRIALLELLLLRGDADEVLREAPALAMADVAWVRSAGRLLEAEALIQLGRHDEAASALEASGADAGSRGDVGRWSERVRGTLLLASGDGEGERVLRELIPTLRQDRGPDGFIVSLMRLDAIAAAARAAGAWALAGHAARQMIDHDPSFAGGHIALALAAEAEGDVERAAAARAEAARLWRRAAASDADAAGARDGAGGAGETGDGDTTGAGTGADAAGSGPQGDSR